MNQLRDKDISKEGHEKMKQLYIRVFPHITREVKHNKVATYGSRTDLIGTWLSKATIFLYHNGYGIIGAGIGTARIQGSNYVEPDYEDDERNMQLKNFQLKRLFKRYFGYSFGIHSC